MTSRQQLKQIAAKLQQNSDVKNAEQWLLQDRANRYVRLAPNGVGPLPSSRPETYGNTGTLIDVFAVRNTDKPLFATGILYSQENCQPQCIFPFVSPSCDDADWKNLHKQRSQLLHNLTSDSEAQLNAIGSKMPYGGDECVFPMYSPDITQPQAESASFSDALAAALVAQRYYIEKNGLPVNLAEKAKPSAADALQNAVANLYEFTSAKPVSQISGLQSIVANELGSSAAVSAVEESAKEITRSSSGWWTQWWWVVAIAVLLVIAVIAIIIALVVRANRIRKEKELARAPQSLFTAS